MVARRTVGAGLLVGVLMIAAVIAKDVAPARSRDAVLLPILTASAVHDVAGETRAYARAATALLSRYDATVATYGGLLDRRDANPELVFDADWNRENARVVDDLRGEYEDAVALSTPEAAMDVQRCIVESTQLTYTGYKMLHDGYLTDGHAAYYLGSHGNWNLNLGVTRMATCRTFLGLLAQPR